MKKVHFVVNEDCDGQRFDVALSVLAEVSRSLSSEVVSSGKATLNGKVAKAGKNVKTGDVIDAEFEDMKTIDLTPENIPIQIVFQDSHLCIINKQQGLVVHPSSNCFNGTLVNALLYHVNDLSGINGELRPGIVHRLDKNTSGLMVVAKSNFAHASLAKQIATKECRRVYMALLEGVVASDGGEINQPVGRSVSDRKLMAVTKNGRDAQTAYTVIRRFPKHTLVKFELKTGRTHQIRVHAKFLGHPVVGDKEYGFSKQKFNLDGQLLHSSSLTFTHPLTNEVLSFSAKLPSYFENILRILISAKNMTT